MPQVASTVDREIAGEAHAAALAASRKLEQLLMDIHDRCSDEDYESIRKAVASALGEIYVTVMLPLEHEYPELEEKDATP